MTEESGLWTFDMVEQRLVAALIVARRVPDRERGWMHVKAYWPDIREADIFDYPGGGIDGVSHIRLRPMPLAPDQMTAMVEAESWLGRFLDERERSLVVLALGWMAAGRRVGWTRIGQIMGERVSRKALARRYVVALARIVAGLNGKGRADVQRIVRLKLAQQARDAAGAGMSSPVRERGRRRRIEVDIVYSD